MNLRLKSLQDQTIVITGATSGIGLATARRAAQTGARVVLAARNDEALHTLENEIRNNGGQALAVAADVGSEQDIQRIAQEAIGRFGGFDTWVNNAGGSIYGRCLAVGIADMRQMFETNFWGVVYGSRIAAAHLMQSGGALINIGSEVSDVAIPLQGIYSASKHAVKGWTDALRIELEDANLPISVTLIKPGAIDTPFTEHAKNYLPDQPKHAPPVYDVESVAEAILYAACNPIRDVFVGGAAKAMSSLNKYAPSLADNVTRKMVIPGTHSGEPRRGKEALYEAGDANLRERGNYPGMVRKSMYTTASMHPVMAGVAMLGAGLLFGAMWRNSGESIPESDIQEEYEPVGRRFRE